MENKIFDYDEVITKKEKLKNDIVAEYKYIQVSTLGGKENTAIILTISLDKKEKWDYGILENSRYYKIIIDIFGVMQVCSSSYKIKKIRKKRVKNLNEAIEYINREITENKGI